MYQNRWIEIQIRFGGFGESSYPPGLIQEDIVTAGCLLPRSQSCFEGL